ncbi:hypothetical protein BSU04_13390 [Caballeronia sordidicola]|uniref:Uncharacterized protein n=1 Tax=Caballeronia sordidicola TaxID=196367 RepID=A0A226X3X0_CABSO|nr:hypothetical protein BSU04_13390 [Caballeronia sordidicola]
MKASFLPSEVLRPKRNAASASLARVTAHLIAKGIFKCFN